MWRKNIVQFAAATSLGVMFMGGAVMVNADTYLIVSDGQLPSNLSTKVERAGGSLETTYPFGVAVASSDNPGFASSISGVRFVVADPGFEVQQPVAELTLESTSGHPPNSVDNDFLFDLQWGHNYVGATHAWDAGIRGQGVRVAVLDTGFDLDHPDLAPNINLALSMDFTGEGLQYGLPNPFSHGSHVAGTIAAADNGFGIIGVAPEAELVLVKVLSDAGSGSFANVIAGIHHAASIDADVINMSLGAMISRIDNPVAVTNLAIAVNKAITHAYQKGTTVIVSAGDPAEDLDGDGPVVRFVNGMSHALGISALTPLNWATNPDQELVPASYTNFGTSMVDFSAPGGSMDYPGNESCTIEPVTAPCYVLDMVVSTGNGGWYWSAGTSMAAPHASGVAALIISENGGSMHPAQVEAAMRSRSLDLGKSGRDDYFGHGLVQSGY